MMGMDRILGWVAGILLAVVIAAFILALVPPGGQVVSAPEAGCLASGGTVGAAVCCLSVEDFPNTCLVGACGCSAENSHGVKTCSCPAGSCFNGTSCVMAIQSFEECVAAGYPVMESYPRQCRVPGGPTFVEQIPPEMTAGGCLAARGHWNECSNRCMLDNAGKPEVVCPALCEALCECGGIAGFGCSEGFTCRLPPGIADALGYCVAGR
jgi:hypothetical protein